MSKGWKRAGGVIITIISVLVLLISAGGTVGIWVVKGQADDVTTALFAPVESALDTANTALAKVDARLANARTRVSNAQEFVGQLGQGQIGNGAVLGAISDTIGSKLGPQIDAAQESIGNALDLVKGVNDTIARLNKLPGVNLPTVTNQLQNAQGAMTSVQNKIQSFRSDLQAAVQGRLQLTAARLNSVLSDLDTSLQSVQSNMNARGTNVQQVQTRMASLKDDIFSWITISAVVLTVFLVWIAISQVVMIYYGWSLIRGKPKDLGLPAGPTPSEDLAAAVV